MQPPRGLLNKRSIRPVESTRSNHPHTVLHVNLGRNIATSDDCSGCTNCMADHGSYCDQVHALWTKFEYDRGEDQMEGHT